MVINDEKNTCNITKMKKFYRGVAPSPYLPHVHLCCFSPASCPGDFNPFPPNIVLGSPLVDNNKLNFAYQE